MLHIFSPTGFDVCVYCKMITTISLVNIHCHTYLHYFSCNEHFYTLSNYILRIYFVLQIHCIWPKYIQGTNCLWFCSVHFSSVQSLSRVPTLCNPMDFSAPVLPVHHQLPESTETQSVMPSNHLILCHPLLPPSIFPSIRVISNESALLIRWPNISVSASASVLSMNTQDWFPSGWTGWISQQSKGLSRVSFEHQSIDSLALSLLFGPTLTSINDYWKNHSFD